MPARIRRLTDNRAATPVIETLRGLLLGTPVGVPVVSVAPSAFPFRSRTA